MPLLGATVTRLSTLVSKRVYEASNFSSFLSDPLLRTCVLDLDSVAYLMSWMILFNITEQLPIILDKICLFEAEQKFWRTASRFLPPGQKLWLMKFARTSIKLKLSADEIKSKILLRLCNNCIDSTKRPNGILNLPSELLISGFDIKDLMDLSCTCWEMFDRLQPYIRSLVHVEDQENKKWRLTLSNVYSAFKKNSAQVEYLLSTHEQFRIFWDFIVNDHKDFHYENFPRRSWLSKNLIDFVIVEVGYALQDKQRPEWLNWIRECGGDICFDLLQIVMGKIENPEIGYWFLRTDIMIGTLPEKMIVYLCQFWRFSNVQEFRQLLGLAKSFTVVLALFGSLFAQGVQNTGVIQLMVKFSATSEQLLEILRTVPGKNNSLISESVFNDLLSDRFDERCWLAFVKKFPNFIMTAAVMQKLASSRIIISDDLLALLILNFDQYSQVMPGKFLHLSRTIPEDLYQIFLFKCLWCQRSELTGLVDVLLDAIHRRFSSTTIKYIARRLAHAEISASQKQELLEIALINGYTEDTIAFLQEHIETDSEV